MKNKIEHKMIFQTLKVPIPVKYTDFVILKMELKKKKTLKENVYSQRKLLIMRF